MVVVIVFSVGAGTMAAPAAGATTAGGLDTHAVGANGPGFAPPQYTMGSVGSLGTVQQQGEWPTVGHDAGRSGYNPDSAGPKTGADARWVYEADNQSRHEPAVVADGHVFVPTRDGLRALDNETGVESWNATDLSVDHVSVAEGVAVATSNVDNEIRAYNATTGVPLWNVTSFDARTAVASNGTVYVERYSQFFDEISLYAFDLTDGTEQWSVQHAGDVGGGLAVAGDTVYATWKLSDGWDREYGVFAMNTSNGEIRWQFEVEGPIAMYPVVVDGTVYVGAGEQVGFDGDWYDPKFYALDATDGHVEWIFDAHARPNGAAVANDTVYVSIGNGVHALDRATGERQWIHRMDGDIDYGLSYERMAANAPAVADGVVYATNDRGFVEALDATTGAELWIYRVEGRATHPAIADGQLYVHAVVTSGDDVVRVYALEQPPLAFSGLSSSAATAGPGEIVTVDVTVENVDDETRRYDLSLMADGVFANEWVAVDRATGQLSAGQSETVTFETSFATAGSWELSIKRALEREAAIGSIPVDVVHSPSADNWPIRGFDQGASDANADTDGPTQSIQERWNVSSFDDDTQPVVADGTAYVVHDQYRSNQPNLYRVAAYDFESGVLEWDYNFTAENRAPVGSATVNDGTAYVYTTSRFFYDDAPDPTVGTVYAFDVADGTLSWSNDIPLNRSMTTDQAPIFANGNVYVAGAVSEQDVNNADASVYALDASTGAIQWHRTVGEENALEQFFTLAYADETLFATLTDETDPNTNDFVESVVAINATTGAQTWKQSSQDLDLNRHVVTRGGLVYVIDRPGNGNGYIAEEIVAYDAADGTEAWRFTPLNVTTSSNEYDQWRLYKPVVTDDAMFVYQQETESSYLYQRLNRVNASTGELEWRRSYYEKGSFVVVDGLVYATGANDRTAIYDAATGEMLGETDHTSVDSAAVQSVVNGTIFGTTNNALRALSEGGHFEFSDLAVASERLGFEDNATVTATVTNVGVLERSWNVNLLVAPDKDRQHHYIWNSPGRSGTLGPGESETITWTVRLDERGDYVFTLQPNYENSGMSAYLDDLTHGVTVSVGDGRDGQTIPFISARDSPTGPDVWSKESYDAGNTGNNSGTGGPVTVGADTVAWSVNHSYEWTSGPTLAANTVFVGGNHVSGGEFVYAHNATDGTLQWQYQGYSSSDVEIPPTYAGGYVYTAASDGRVYQFNATTGERLWTYNGLDDVGGITVVDDVAYVAGTVYTGSDYAGTLHALNASTREVLWTFQRVSSSYGMEIKPAVVGGTVYVTSDDGYTYALAAETGVLEWDRPIAGAGSSLHSPVVEDGVVYVDDTTWDSTAAQLYALDAANGTTIWSTPANVDGYTGASPALANDTLFFTADGALRAVDVTGGASGGTELWSTTICSAARHSPVYAGGTVYVGTTDSALRAYNASTGDLVWRSDGYDEYAFTPSVIDGLLYTTGLENTDGVFSLLALTGGPTAEPKTIFDYSGLSVSNEAVAVGESLTVAATVQNQGDEDCVYAADLVIDGSVEDTTTGPISPGSSSREAVEFTHSFSSPGTYNVTIEDLPSIEVTVTESAADPVVSPTTRDFGDVELGNSTDRFVQISNEGTETLYLNDASITGTDADAFTIYSVSQTTVYPGDSVTIWMRFEPPTAGPKSATLEVTTTFEGTVTAALAGNGISEPPEILVTPTSVVFGDVTTSTRAIQTVTIENVGGSTLTFDNATLGSSELDAFEVTAGNATTALGPGETHDVSVEFTPPIADADSTTLSVFSNDPTNSVVSVAVSGSGVDPAPTPTTTPTTTPAPTSTPTSTPSRTSTPTTTGDRQPVETSSGVSSTEGGLQLDVQNARAGVPVDSPLPFAPDAAVALTDVSVTTNTDRDYTITVTSTDTPSGNTTFSLPVGQETLGYFEVTHSVPDSELDAVRFTFRISKTTLEDAGIDPVNVSLTRHSHGVQSAVPTSHVGDNATHVTFQADSPGLSVFAMHGTSTQPTETETTTPAETSAPVTETPTTASPTEPHPTATDRGTDETGTSTPGFGAAITLLSLLVVALVAIWRRS